MKAGTKGYFFFCLFLVVILSGCASMNQYQRKGTLALEGLKNPVTVLRDEKGMAYIRAGNADDLMMAQGFVTAQDRLFQMQLTRLMVEGRISELAGPVAKKLDMRMRTIGLHYMAKRHAEILNPETKNLFQHYVDGINAFIEQTPEDLHLEFKLAGIKPDRWEVSHSLSILYYMGYSTAANLSTEIIAQMLLDTVGFEKASQLMPLNFNPDDPNDTGEIALLQESSLASLSIKSRDLFPFTENRDLRMGSNNWALAPASSHSGSAVLAGDPHLDPRILPGVWYPLGLFAPGIRAVSANIPGIPGMAVGRTDHIALSATNNYGDMLDLYIETVDPKNPNRYLEGDRSILFKTKKETLKIKDKKAPEGFITENFTIRYTNRGPVVSNLLKGLKTEQVITMRFAPNESMEPEIGIDKVLFVKKASELADATKKFSIGSFNWVFADSSGNIGHQASGRVPIRFNGDGTFPRKVIDSNDNWHGWIPFDQMPGSMNPERNWIGTCNHKTVTSNYPYYYSSYFASSYRYKRLKELMASSGRKSVADMWNFQRDTKNLMAQSLTPVFAKIMKQFEDTKDLGKILSSWDFKDNPDQTAPTVFQTTYRFLALGVFEDDLGYNNAIIMLNNWYFWQERFERMVLKGDSIWFDDIRTKDRVESLEDQIHKAALAARDYLSKRLGKEPEKWQWGNVHTLELVNPLMRKGLAKTILGTGPMSMGGSGETLYRGWYDFDKPFAVTHTASLRMVVDFADNEKVLAVMPGGISGRTFHPHMMDLVEPFMSGEKQYWWFSDKAIKEHTKTSLVLQPK